MSPFDEATIVVPTAPDGYAWDVPDGWQQGRGAWGGLVVGALARSVLDAEPDSGRTLRSVSAQISAPAVVGRHHIQVRLVRRGRSMSTWSATLHDEQDRAVASLVAILGTARGADAPEALARWGRARPPLAPPAGDVPAVAVEPPFGPVFGRHCSFRPVSGTPLGGGAAESVGWVDFAAPTTRTAISLIALVDAWWSASLAALTELRLFGTVNFMANLLLDPATVPADEPLLQHSFVSAAHEGFVSEHRRLWTADGRLVVDNLQTIVVG